MSERSELTGGTGRWGGRPAMWWLVAAPPVAAVIAYATTGGVDTSLAVAIGVGVLLWCPWWVGRWLRARAALGRAGWRSAAQWEDRARAAEDDARRRERARLAAQMHDVVGHDLARAALGLGGLELDRTLPADARRAIGEVREQVSAAAEHLAQAVSALAADRAPAPASGEVVAVVDGVRAAGREVVLAPGDPAPVFDGVDPAVCALVVRVVREGLTTAVKHAGDAPVDVSIGRRADDLDVVVRSRGTSDRPAPVSGRGLAGLAADVGSFGGSLEHGRSGHDHLLAARLPVHAPATSGRTEVVGTDSARRSAVGAVRRSRSTAVRGTAAAIATALLLVVAYRAVDVATSVLPAQTFDALVPGTERAAVAGQLPMRTRTDGTGIPRPPGSECEHYSASADPFSLDLHRLCWTDGVLVHKDLIVRSAADPGTIGT